MIIRELKVNELATINSLAYQIWPHAFKDILSPEQIAYMLNWMYDLKMLEQQHEQGHRFFVVEEQGEALGFIGLEFIETKQSVRIHKLYVLPNTQGKGLGKLCIEHAKTFALSLHAKRVFLNVNRFNKAVEFYKHLGFVIEKVEDIDIGSGYLMEDYVMSLDLPA